MQYKRHTFMSNQDYSFIPILGHNSLCNAPINKSRKQERTKFSTRIWFKQCVKISIECDWEKLRQKPTNDNNDDDADTKDCRFGIWQKQKAYSCSFL